MCRNDDVGTYLTVYPDNSLEKRHSLGYHSNHDTAVRGYAGDLSVPFPLAVRHGEFRPPAIFIIGSLAVEAADHDTTVVRYIVGSGNITRCRLVGVKGQLVNFTGGDVQQRDHGIGLVAAGRLPGSPLSVIGKRACESCRKNELLERRTFSSPCGHSSGNDRKCKNQFFH